MCAEMLWASAWEFACVCLCVCVSVCVCVWGGGTAGTHAALGLIIHRGQVNLKAHDYTTRLTCTYENTYGTGLNDT